MATRGLVLMRAGSRGIFITKFTPMTVAGPPQTTMRRCCDLLLMIVLFNVLRTWTTPRPISGAGSVRPRLLRLQSGALILSGGRLCKELAQSAPTCVPADPNRGSGGGIFLWINADGLADLNGTRNGSEWTPYCVTAAHNELWTGDPSLRFANNTLVQAYTSLVPLGPNSVGISYAHGWILPQVATFMMRVDLPNM